MQIKLAFKAEKKHSVRFDATDTEGPINAVYLNKDIVPKPYDKQQLILNIEFKGSKK